MTRHLCPPTLVALLLLLVLAVPAAAQVRSVPPGDTDLTLKAMRDEMERSKEKLQLGQLPRPYFIEYRLLDFDIRTVSASFGAILSSNTVRNRVMAVDVRVGDYRLDSSNFVSNEGFQGFIGSTGTVGIDRDYESLRQDLWLATDQAYKSALDSLARKRAHLGNLAGSPTVDDFSRERPLKMITPRVEPDWSGRNWEAEARAATAAFRNYPELHSSRAVYYLLYVTQYLMTSEGTEIRISRSLAAIEAGVETQTEEGVPVHNYYTVYANRPADLPAAEKVRAELDRISRELVALREAPPAPDYVGPVLFEAPAAGALLAQLLPASVSGSRPPLSMMPMFERMMEQFGGRSEWSGKVGQRVLPASVSLTDDPTMKEYRGAPLIGGYKVDEEGVQASRVALVESGMLRGMLMSRRPGPDFGQSNGHGRAAFLNEPRAAMSNVIVESSEAQSPDELRKKFLQMCKAEGRAWCVVVKRMDHPVLGAQRRQESNELIAALASGSASGDRLPLLVYRVYVADGREELIRGAWLTGVNLRALRNVAAVGNDHQVYSYCQDSNIPGTSLGAFGTAQGGLPTSIVAPSLLLGEVEVRGARRDPKRPPLLPAPPLDKTH